MGLSIGEEGIVHLAINDVAWKGGIQSCECWPPSWTLSFLCRLIYPAPSHRCLDRSANLPPRELTLPPLFADRGW